MSTKAERTTAFIIETVAPIFSRQGYVGTSMSDLTEATGLTKGALYGNFEKVKCNGQQKEIVHGIRSWQIKGHWWQCPAPIIK